ncbi:MAG: amino acid ABC transporter permease [Candidatus Desulfovibrio faecigallinarum]|uniref:amino acid ABC transporter permease n=1 Tax=Desulfovibrio sp. An276 TaxID=1965618 RepID=UPI000B38025C|nr:amino acid ABC transporter permease [Desulfovibrio sp. An276]MBU3831849.1 amino acid ABC transporter permease [Candidatus Desulfovibrio faecigallinarum]OUO55281.1 amino acid ABC transporter permease [Desulfovibrio sp. An276]
MAPETEKSADNESTGNIVVLTTQGPQIPKPWGKRIITAWSISLMGAIITLIVLCTMWPDPYLDVLTFLPDGILVTFEVTALAICCAVPLGLLTGLGRIAKNPIINLGASTYVEIIRGIPLLVQIFYIYYALSKFLQVSSLTSAVVAISFCYGAYMGEVFRAGIMAIPKGQTEAARSLGFNRFQTMFYVILPQAWRTILPPVGNECIAMLKDTSLVSVMAMPDLMQRGRSFAAKTYLYFETYTIVALVYLIITLLLSKCVAIMEAKLNYYDRRK